MGFSLPSPWCQYLKKYLIKIITHFERTLIDRLQDCSLKIKLVNYYLTFSCRSFCNSEYSHFIEVNSYQSPVKKIKAKHMYSELFR